MNRTEKLIAKLDQNDAEAGGECQESNALRAVLLRMDAEIDAGERPENWGQAPVPANMLRVYLHGEIASALGVEL